MSPTRSTGRLLVMGVLALVMLVALAGCSERGSIERTGPAEGGAAGSAADSTTTAPEGSATTTVETTADTTSTTAEAPTTGVLPPAEGAVPETAPESSWSLNAAQYRGRDGTRVAYVCPPGGPLGSLWGTGPFTDDSSVCTAAVFAGLITMEQGGTVVIEIAPGRPSYGGATANGATANEYGEWGGSFVFPTA